MSRSTEDQVGRLLDNHWPLRPSECATCGPIRAVTARAWNKHYAAEMVKAGLLAIEEERMSPALPRGAHIGTHGITIDGAELPWYVSTEGVIVREEYGTTNPVAHTIQVRIIVDGPVIIDHAVDVHDHGDGMLEVVEHAWAGEDE